MQQNQIFFRCLRDSGQAYNIVIKAGDIFHFRILYPDMICLWWIKKKVSTKIKVSETPDTFSIYSWRYCDFLDRKKNIIGNLRKVKCISLSSKKHYANQYKFAYKDYFSRKNRELVPGIYFTIVFFYHLARQPTAQVIQKQEKYVICQIQILLDKYNMQTSTYSEKCL